MNLYSILINTIFLKVFILSKNKLLLNISCILGTTVAFHVYLKNSISSLQKNQILIYDNVIANIGEGYDTTTGKFTAPKDGVYSFTWTYLTKKGARAYIGGFIDGKQVVWGGHGRPDCHLGEFYWASCSEDEEGQSILDGQFYTNCYLHTRPLYFLERIQNFWRMISLS